jgi:hypothetical protein
MGTPLHRRVARLLGIDENALRARVVVATMYELGCSKMQKYGKTTAPMLLVRGRMCTLVTASDTREVFKLTTELNASMGAAMLSELQPCAKPMFCDLKSTLDVGTHFYTLVARAASYASVEIHVSLEPAVKAAIKHLSQPLGSSPTDALFQIFGLVATAENGNSRVAVTELLGSPLARFLVSLFLIGC